VSTTSAALLSPLLASAVADPVDAGRAGTIGGEGTRTAFLFVVSDCRRTGPTAARLLASSPNIARYSQDSVAGEQPIHLAARNLTQKAKLDQSQNGLVGSLK
jgi:hypothetical protein